MWIVLTDWNGNEDLAFRDSEIEARQLFEKRKNENDCYVILAKIIEHSDGFVSDTHKTVLDSVPIRSGDSSLDLRKSSD